LGWRSTDERVTLGFMDPRLRVMVAEGALERSSYYDLLRVAPGGDPSSLQRAFHEFALAFHPDRHAHEDTTIQTAAKKVFERGVEAYTVLRNPTAAQLYDKRLQEGMLRLPIEDMSRIQRPAPVEPPPLRKPSHPPPTIENAFVSAMTTPDGRTIAKRVEKLIHDQRYREAYLQLGLLETVEPNNPAVRKRADRVGAYLKRMSRQ